MVFYATILVNATPNFANAVSRATRFYANSQGRPCQIYGRYNVSAINPSWNLRELDTACSRARAKHDKLSKSTMAKVETTLAGTDTSNLKGSFRRALSISIPPLAVYRNHHPDAYSDLIFGVPLVELETNQDNVSRVIKMCIEEIEKKGINTMNIHLVS